MELKKGISLYEVVKIIDSKALFLDGHIKRLHNSVKLKNLKIWLTDAQITERINKLIEVNKVKQGRLKFVFRFYNDKNMFLCFFLNKIEPTKEIYESGVKLTCLSTERLDPNIKKINYDLRSAVKILKEQEKAFEALLINSSNKVTEGSKSNFFLIKDKTIFTSPKTNVLPGITREYVFQICEKAGIKIIEKNINKNDLSEFDSAFISGTSIGILSVNQIDKIQFDLKNPIFKCISKEYNKIVNRELRKDGHC